MGADQEPPPPSNGPPARAPKIILGDARFLYCPLWEPRANDVFCYLCEPFWDAGAGELLPEDAIGAGFDDPKRVLALDLETLSKATAQADEVAAHYGVLNVLIPVHYETLAAPEPAEAYIERCDKVIWPVVDSVYLEIVRPPVSLSRDGLGRVTDRIAPYGRGLMLRVGPDFDRFDRIPADDILSVGLDLRADQRDEEEILPDLRQFASGTGTHGLQSHVHGLKTLTASMAAVSAGFHFVGCDAIAPPLETWAADEETVKPTDLFKALLPTE